MTAHKLDAPMQHAAAGRKIAGKVGASNTTQGIRPELPVSSCPQCEAPFKERCGECYECRMDQTCRKIVKCWAFDPDDLDRARFICENCGHMMTESGGRVLGKFGNWSITDGLP